MIKNYQNMSEEVLREQLNIILNKTSGLITRKNELTLALKEVKYNQGHLNLEKYYIDLYEAIDSIKLEVISYFTKKRKKVIWKFWNLFKKEKNLEYFERVEQSILETLDKIKIFIHNKDIENIVDLFDMDFSKKVDNLFIYDMPISMEPLYIAILNYQLAYPNIIKHLNGLKKEEDDYNQQLIRIEQQLRYLELEEFYMRQAIISVLINQEKEYVKGMILLETDAIQLNDTQTLIRKLNRKKDDDSDNGYCDFCDCDGFGNW